MSMTEAPAAGALNTTAHTAHRWRLDIEHATDDTVPEARHWIRDRGTELGLDTDDIELLVSELLGNVGRHADGGPAWITLAHTPNRLVLGVGDHRPDKPLIRRGAVDDWAENGRGLAIAYAIARRIRIDKRRPGTKRVVAELPIGDQS